MSLASYVDLQASVASWLNRSDLTAQIPDFIRLAEDRFGRALRVRQMEAAMTPADIVNGSLALPAGAIGVKTLWITGYETSPLKPQSYEAVLAMGAYGIPTHYAQVGSTLYFDGSGTVNGIVYQPIPALATAGTNWLLTQYPSAYLFASLVEAWLFLRNASEANAWEQRLQAVLSEISGNDQRDKMAGPLVVRAR